jgi:dienelactone hydrolase
MFASRSASGFVSGCVSGFASFSVSFLVSGGVGANLAGPEVAPELGPIAAASLSRVRRVRGLALFAVVFAAAKVQSAAASNGATHVGPAQIGATEQVGIEFAAIESPSIELAAIEFAAAEVAANGPAASASAAGGLAALQAPVVSDSRPRCELSLVLDPLGQYGRSAVFSDPVLAELVSDPAWAPTEGLAVSSAEGRTATWRAAEIDASGKLDGGARGNSWWFQRWTHDRDEVLLLEAPGAGTFYAGGAPRMGDLYSLGIVRAPIALRKGANDVLVRIGRGQPSVAWSRPPAPIYLESFDRTLPDVVIGPANIGGERPLRAAVLVTNATTEWARGLAISAQIGAAAKRDSAPHITALPPLAPLETRKVAIGIPQPRDPMGESVAIELALHSATGEVLHRDGLELAVRRATQHYTATFVSNIDRSVQYFSVAPPLRANEPGEKLALVLTLHGASVEARGQAAAYAPKDWCYIVAPTNRRPFGFDWEDWGRRDAIEVLDYVLGSSVRGPSPQSEPKSEPNRELQSKLQSEFVAVRDVEFDLRRVYLTGHSMGGHGTWQIGARYADRFAALAPSAGWSDFWSYMGADASVPSDPIGALLHRASNGSRTLLWAPNYAKLGVYVLHGDADDNVPVAQARRMREELSKFHRDFAYFEQPGAGHWWGNECVDWPQIMEFFQRRSLPDREAATEVTVRLVDLDAARSSGFATVLAQTRPLEVSELRARAVPTERRFEVQTTNIEAFELRDAAVDGSTVLRSTLLRSNLRRRWDAWPEGEGGRVTVDGADLELPIARRSRAADGWTLRRIDGRWQLEPEDFRPEAHKQPGASGPFKEAFDRGFVLVYGTSGGAEENAWSLAKARFDADQFRYRGNASPRLASDLEVVAALEGVRDDTRNDTRHELTNRNLVLYGNAKSNAAWSKVVEPTALDVQPGRVRVGARTLEGEDLTVLAVRPNARDKGGLVALVGGTGIVGMRAANHAPYFVSGAGFPDWWIARASFLAAGLPQHLGAGYFRADWSADDGADTFLRAAARPR